MANKEIKIGDYVINETSYPYMIAEIGINHNGDIEIAKKLMDAANATGWNSVKFQKRNPELAVPEAQKSVMRDIECEMPGEECGEAAGAGVVGAGPWAGAERGCLGFLWRDARGPEGFKVGLCSWTVRGQGPRTLQKPRW